MIAWYAGTGCVYKAHERAWRHRQRHPADSRRDEQTGALDHPAHTHHDRNAALEVGMPGQYDVGMQRVAWLGHLLTNWCGDDGFVHRLTVDIIGPNTFGNTSWCRGRVSGRRVDEGVNLIDLELWTEDQDGKRATRGSATVELPSSDLTHH
jgi:hypothetical protein